jgi:glycosyltransferase involved in cell wall biosynthesis
MAGGVERVLTLKANYLAEHYGYDITIILTEGKGKPLFYPLSDKIKVVNLDINFEQLWRCSFVRKIAVYLSKQRRYKRLLTAELMRLRPDITVSLLRREINFINEIADGSRKIGELHVNRANYRNFEANDTNIVKRWFAKFWMSRLLVHLRKLDQLVVLTEEDRQSWHELSHVSVIPDPLAFVPGQQSTLTVRRVIAVGRYVYQKGFDLLLQAWAKVERECPDWQLAIYGDGDRAPYQRQAEELGLRHCQLRGRTADIQAEYLNSSLFVFSSRFEGFGMVLIEAMACGLPVVSFDCPCGPKDIVSDGQDGLLVPAGNVEQLAQAMIRVMKHTDLARQLGRQAVEKSEQYHIELLAERWRSLFERLK